jgi:hypothetical protein
MKASALMAKLAQLIAEHGDRAVVYYDPAVPELNYVHECYEYVGNFRLE